MNIQTVKNVSDCIPLYLPHSLYLKPYAKLSISVSLPTSIPGKTISNWDVMEKLRQIILPETFSVIKISKSTLEFIRFDAEIEDKEKLKNVLNRLDGRSIKLSNFAENVKVRAKEARDGFPLKHDWDSFFRDARDMDEMKPGERPDTIHISNLPVRWFCPRHLENAENVKPSENIFKRIFEKFGDVRSVDIPICDPYRPQMKSHMSGMKTFSFEQDLFFEGYVQFSEYISFVRAMDAFRGMKLIRKEGDKNYGVTIAVNFDKTKHLSDLSTKRRAIVRERFISKEKAKEDEEKKKLAEEEAKKERERRKQEELKQAELERQRMREEKRKERQLKKLRDKEQTELSVKIREEEKKLMAAQRKLESIRLLEALFERIKIKVSHERPSDLVESKSAKHKEKSKKNDLNNKSHGTDLRNKLVKKIKSAQEKEYQKYKARVKRVKEGKIIMSNILTARSPSVNSISSNDSILNESDRKKRKKKKKESGTSDSDTSSDSSANASGSEEQATNVPPHQMMMPPHGFPMQPVFNPQTGTWMGMYSYAPMFAQGPIRPNFISNSMPIRGYRGAGRGVNPRFPRGRGQYRGRGTYYNSYESNPHYRHYSKHKYDEQEHDEHDYRNSRSRSRSRSSSRSRSRSRSKSYSRSRGRRSRSYTKSRHSRSRSKSHSRSKSKKLVSTRRRTKSPESSRSRSRSTRSSSGWSHSDNDKHRSNRKRSWSRTSSRDRSKSKTKTERKSSRFDSHTPKPEVVLGRDKIFEDAEKIKKPVQKRLRRRQKSRSRDRSRESGRESSKKRNRSSSSADSAKFEPPKHRERSATPEKEWD